MHRAILTLVVLGTLACRGVLSAEPDPESTIIAMANLLTRPDGGLESRWKPLLSTSHREELLEQISRVRKQAVGAVTREVEIESESACRILYEFRDHEFLVDLRLWDVRRQLFVLLSDN